MENAITYREITSYLHVSMVLFVIALAILTSVAGVRMKRTGHLQQFSNWLGVSLLGLWITYNVYYFLPANFRLDTSLPLHVCDFMAIVASLSLIKPGRKTSALLYFCALALTSQAILTPTGNQDPTTLRFWLFWFLHGGIISAAIYDLVVRKYQPVFKDCLFVIGCDFLYVAVILPLDVILGWNYGFIGNIKPDTPTIIDALGPWPQRIVWMVGLVVIVQLIMYLPWKWYRHNRPI